MAAAAELIMDFATALGLVAAGYRTAKVVRADARSDAHRLSQIVLGNEAGTQPQQGSSNDAFQSNSWISEWIAQFFTTGRQQSSSPSAGHDTDNPEEDAKNSDEDPLLEGRTNNTEDEMRRSSVLQNIVQSTRRSGSGSPEEYRKSMARQSPRLPLSESILPRSEDALKFWIIFGFVNWAAMHGWIYARELRLIIVWMYLFPGAHEVLINNVYTALLAPSIKKTSPYVIQPLSKLRKHGQSVASSWLLPLLTKSITQAAKYGEDEDLLQAESSLNSMLEHVILKKRELQKRRLQQGSVETNESRPRSMRATMAHPRERNQQHGRSTPSRRRTTFSRHEEVSEGSSDEPWMGDASDEDKPGDDDSPTLAFVDEPPGLTSPVDTMGERLMRRQGGGQPTENKEDEDFETKNSQESDSDRGPLLRQRRRRRHS